MNRPRSGSFLAPARFMVALSPDKLLDIFGSYAQTEPIACYLCNLLDEWDDKAFHNIIIYDFALKGEAPEEESFFYIPSPEVAEEEEDIAVCDAYIRGLVCGLVQCEI